MIYSEQFIINFKDIDKGRYLKDEGILEIFENIATHHSDAVGFGVNDYASSNVAWIILEWEIKVLKRPKYGELLNVNTWGRTSQSKLSKAFTYRDFEMYDQDNNLLVIGSSKWALLNVKERKPIIITDEIMEKYNPIEKSVFNETQIAKIKAPEEYDLIYNYQVLRKDVDFNNHMHNLYYLDLAYETLPEEVYLKRPFNEIRISYKKEITLNEKLICKYKQVEDENIISIYSEDETILHAIITLK